MLLGFDAAKHQFPISFADARASGMRFAILKCTEGGDYEDPRFASYWKDLVALDPASVPEDRALVRGVYHFARSDLRTSSGTAAGELEARNLCRVLTRAGGHGAGCLPPALDWEHYGGTQSRNRDWIRAFVRVVESELGRSPMIYTGRNVWYYTTGDFDEYVHLPLWQVKYSSEGGDADGKPAPLLRTKGRRPWPYTFWQWSGGSKYAHHAPVPGVGSDAPDDVNRFDGTWEDLLALAGFLERPLPSSPPASDVPPVSSVFPLFDLQAVGSTRHQASAAVQGLLMANGYGPAGLVDARGLPDGLPGAKTQSLLRAFKREHGLSDDTVVDPTTWFLLLTDS